MYFRAFLLVPRYSFSIYIIVDVRKINLFRFISNILQNYSVTRQNVSYEIDKIFHIFSHMLPSSFFVLMSRLEFLLDLSFKKNTRYFTPLPTFHWQSTKQIPMLWHKQVFFIEQTKGYSQQWLVYTTLNQVGYLANEIGILSWYDQIYILFCFRLCKSCIDFQYRRK